MTAQMGLVLFAIAFVAGHFLLSHPLRAPLVLTLGEKAFRGFYSLFALGTFGGMLWFYRSIGREPALWSTGRAVWIIGALLLWVASVLFIGSFAGNPALAGSPGPKGGPNGVLRITRHPMMWAFAIWAAVHLTVVATPKALVLDGSIMALALVGSALQDRKKAGLMGDTWHEWTAQTAFVPFTGGVANPGAVALIGGTLLFLLATWLHPIPVPPWGLLG